jgi:endonuclease/exonuclease/phosphatase family metal-dependent hydrolase
MGRKKDATGRVIQDLVAGFLKLPWKVRVAIVVLVAVAGAIFAVAYYRQSQPPSVNLPPGTDRVVFCHWNMENLFDDKDDKRRQVDEEYDAWFVANPDDRKRKYQRLTEVLLKFNKGTGPDIIVGNEIESSRAAELLKDALNAALPEGASKYQYVAMKDLDAGRHIAPCVISRYPLSGAKLLGKRQRILEVQVTVNNHTLHLVASHWTSQLSDKGDDETRGRFAYANAIHEVYTDAIRANPKVDFLVCGDFNDKPDADSVVKHLHMIGDAKLVTADANPPKLLGLLSDKSPERFGTHYYSGPLIYDHIGISPGLLDDAGWGCLVDTVEVPTDGLIRSGARTRRPWRYGSKNDDAAGRGYSDHFPVLVTLKVAP